MDKVDYLETHRFAVGDVSKEKLRGFRSTLASLQEHHTEIVGAVVFGSQITGRAGEGSDVDAVVFVDADRTGLTDTPNAKLSDTKGDRNWEEVSAGLGAIIRTEIEDRLAIPTDKRGGIKVRLISSARVDNELDAAIAYEKNAVAAKASGNFVSGGDIPATDFGLLFHMQLGTGLDDYRRQVLSRLQTEGDIGNTVWLHHVVWDVQFGENGKLVGIDRVSAKLFPETVSEASVKFGLTAIK